MASPPGAPTPGAPEKLAVRSMFDRIAPRYDLLNRLLSAGTDVRWRRRAVAALGLPTGARVLDLCAGTADLLLEWTARSAGKGAGVDLSLEMLRRGAAKLRRRGLFPGVGLACGDAERLPLLGGSFDGAMVAFGIRNVGDVDAALREVTRVLRPAGRLVILEFGMPRGLFGACYRIYFGHVLPLVGRLVSGDASAYRYLPASVGRFDSPEALGARLERAGFRDVVGERLSLGIAWIHSATRP